MKLNNRPTMEEVGPMKHSDWKYERDELMADDINETDASLNLSKSESISFESDTSKANCNHQSVTQEIRGTKESFPGQSKRETFARNAENANFYRQYGFVPIYVKNKSDGKLRSAAECAKCKVIICLGERGMKKHQGICQKGRTLKNALLYEALHFKHLSKSENNGVSAFQCLICKKIFRQRLSKVKAKSHRRACTLGEKSVKKHANKGFNKAKTLAKVTLDPTKFRKKKIITEKGKAQIAAECIHCQLSFVDNEFFMNVHEYRCSAFVVDVKDPEVNASSTKSAPLYRQLGYCKVTGQTAVGPTHETTIKRQMVRCLTCSRCLFAKGQSNLQGHRNQCHPLSDLEKDLLTKLNFVSKFAVSRHGSSILVAECCLCGVMFGKRTEENLQAHRLKCKTKDELNTSESFRDERTKSQIEEVNLEADWDLPDLQSELKNVLIDTTKFRERQITMKNGDLQAIAQCIQCEISFFDMDSHHLKLHEYRCTAIAVHKTPKIDDGEVVPLWKKLGYGEIIVPRLPNVKKNRRSVFSCLICSRCIADKGPRHLQSHRKQCQPVSDIEKKLFRELGFNLKYAVTGNGQTVQIAECSACKILFADKKEESLQSHRNDCKTDVSGDFKLNVERNDKFSLKQVHIKSGVAHFEKIKVESDLSIGFGVDMSSTDIAMVCPDRSREQACFVCNTASNLHHENLLEAKSKHSNTRIFDFIEKWLVDNSPKRMNIDAGSCICVDCLDRIDQYDLMCVTAERIEKDFRDALRCTESLAMIEPKIEKVDHNPKNSMPTRGPGNGETCNTNNSKTDNDTYQNEEEFLPNMVKIIRFKCTECNEILDGQKALMRHEHSAVNYVPIEDDEQVYDCSECPSQLHGKVKFEEHMLSHQKQSEEMKQFNCKICGYKMEDEKAFGEHMEKHEKIPVNLKQLQCILCEKILCNNSTLESHVRVHMGERNYQCDRCGLKIRSRTHLNSHMLRMHSDVKKPVNCDVCGKTIGCSLGMKKHLETHSGIKRFACSIFGCGKKFLSSGNRNAHEKTHDRSRPDKIHSCELCERKFTRKHLLRDHMAKQHSVMETSPP